MGVNLFQYKTCCMLHVAFVKVKNQQKNDAFCLVIKNKSHIFAV